MNNLNQLIVEGNVTRLPEVKETDAGLTICKISLAVDRRSRNADGEKTDTVSFFDVETFGKTAENCAKYVQKGQGLRIVGYLKQNRWKDKNGRTMSRVTIIAHQVDFKPMIARREMEGHQELKNLSEAASAATEEISPEGKPIF